MKKGTWSSLTVAALCMVLFATACAATNTATITSTQTKPVTSTVTTTLPPITTATNPPTSTGPIITTTTLQGGKVNIAYSQTLAASGGSNIFTAWVVITGTLPVGLNLNSATGVISGTPTIAGTVNFKVQVTDSAGAAATQDLNIVITVS